MSTTFSACVLLLVFFALLFVLFMMCCSFIGLSCYFVFRFSVVMVTSYTEGRTVSWQAMNIYIRGCKCKFLYTSVVMATVR